jgi:hypothetical protein
MGWGSIDMLLLFHPFQVLLPVFIHENSISKIDLLIRQFDLHNWL